MTDATNLQNAGAELASSELLKSQIEQFSNFDTSLTPGGSLKGVMTAIGKSADLWQVPPEEIVVLPGLNPRVHNKLYYEGLQNLAEGMAANGYMQDKPLAVYLAKVDGVDRLVLQDGHRRLAAALLAKSKMGAPIKTVPVVAKPKGADNASLLKDMLHANESTPFTVYEKAVIAKRFKAFGWTDKQIAEEMGCTTAFVGQMLTMAGAPQYIQELVDNGHMSATMAIDLVKEHGEQAESVAREAVSTAKAKGRTKVTAKDVASPADQKAKNAKKVAYELYRNLKKLREDAAIEKKLDAKMIEIIDQLLQTVETIKKPKPVAAPKPIKVKAAAKKAPAKKAAAKKAPTTAKKAPWDQQKAA